MIASKLIWVSMVLAIAACSTAKPEVEVGPAVREQMSELDRSITELQWAFAARAQSTPEGRREIVTLLSSIEHSAMHLDVHTTATHDRASIGVLRAIAKAAREGAEKDPPVYSFATQVTKTCAACHH